MAKKKTEKVIVFMDTKNKKVDKEYAELIINCFRKQTGWKVEPGTRIHDELTKFSKGYSKIKREPIEVVTIFQIANGLLNVKPTK